ncbi:UDP-2,4-diacetamido-2,4,6-trideoxy-beta-L-altropyranose hydrolase [Bermanella marisrubri]|uniref:Hypothetical FlmD n=1 Tax=Bermanella marisrubri TaxID=207949 RepID=Q1N2Z0_9GAMM|nr:UDP-2,4-diacetamido-2,4,6-trideoxy-beta-L-altropyranose hydrolase [Bermanella marisrubri]EAT12529.1 hypothetical FlmD [Oceanobacter sp. RED65] [Bermanella marisrubri]QIZ84913.1 UDP-2,4-diacetamido-2,4,6-trideoxy-beta-L-altropyranose hydrolase [Bermanella marisrubri]
MNVIFRIEANNSIGLGHLMRAFSLAHWLSKEYKCTFVISDKSISIKNEIEKRGYVAQLISYSEDTLEDAIRTCSLIEKLDDSVAYIVVDDYRLDEAWESYCSDRLKINMVVIDDLDDRPHNCDYIIDGSLGRCETSYARSTINKNKFFGIKYCLLSPYYRELRKDAIHRRKLDSGVNNILVSFGATDPKNFSLKALKAIKESCFNGSVTVITTRYNKNIKTIEEYKNKDVQLLIDHDDIPSLIINADLCIGALGISLLERSCLGLPSICLKVAENQNYNATSAFDFGISDVIDEDDIVDSINKNINKEVSERRILMNHLMSTVDGLGAYRVAIKCFGLMPSVQLRELKYSDSESLFEWQNQPYAREYSRNSSVPSLEEHNEWIRLSLNDERRHMWIIMADGNEAGYVRLDDKVDNYEVSILIDSCFQGLGIARGALEELKMKTEKPIQAFIHKNNVASLRMFLATGFEYKGDNYYQWSPE